MAAIDRSTRYATAVAVIANPRPGPPGEVLPKLRLARMRATTLRTAVTHKSSGDATPDPREDCATTVPAKAATAATAVPIAIKELLRMALRLEPGACCLRRGEVRIGQLLGRLSRRGRASPRLHRVRSMYSAQTSASGSGSASWPPTAIVEDCIAGIACVGAGSIGAAVRRPVPGLEPARWRCR